MAQPANTTNPTPQSITFTQPFAAEYPHIILSNGIYYELSCPVCTGNARSDPPYAFFTKPGGLLSHLRKRHNILKPSLARFLANPASAQRQLSLQGVAAIQAGNGLQVISRRSVALVDGQRAPVRKPAEGVLRELYPTIARKTDGTIVELACNHCDGNARADRGTGNTGKLVFFQGVNGLKMHISESHESVDVAGVLNNCSTPITQPRFQQLKQDQTGTLIQKFEGTMEKGKGWQGKGGPVKSSAAPQTSMASPAGGQGVQRLKREFDAAPAPTTAPCPLQQVMFAPQPAVQQRGAADGGVGMFSEPLTASQLGPALAAARQALQPPVAQIGAESATAGSVPSPFQRPTTTSGQVVPQRVRALAPQPILTTAPPSPPQRPAVAAQQGILQRIRSAGPASAPPTAASSPLQHPVTAPHQVIPDRTTATKRSIDLLPAAALPYGVTYRRVYDGGEASLHHFDGLHGGLRRKYSFELSHAEMGFPLWWDANGIREVKKKD